MTIGDQSLDDNRQSKIYFTMYFSLENIKGASEERDRQGGCESRPEWETAKPAVKPRRLLLRPLSPTLEQQAAPKGHP